jgi:hypothetical protein
VNSIVDFARGRATHVRLLLAGMLVCSMAQRPARAADWLPAGDMARPTISGGVEALLLWRSGVPERPLYFESADPATVPLDAGGIGTGMGAGPRYAIQWSRDGERAFEVNYFNVGSFTGSRGVLSPGGDLEQANILGFRFPDVTAASAVSSAAIQSLELNRRLPLGRFDGDFLYGFRWVEWNDGLTIRDTTITGLQTGSDLFITDTISSLYGAQVGLDLVLWGSRDRAWIEGLGKAGLYGTTAVQNSFVDSVSTDQITRSNAAAAAATSFVGEVGVTGCVRLSDHWVARTGFTMFWLGNVAAAADQLSVNNLYSREIVSAVDTGADVFLYGVNLGLEASW